MDFLTFARQLGFDNCLEFDSTLLVPEQRIRDFCFENRCGNYGNNYMCPPHIGTLEAVKNQLKRFQRGALLQHSSPVDIKNDSEGLRQTKLDFHNKVLRLEDFMRNGAVGEIWGMIGGSCALCRVCTARSGEPCPHPKEARTSLESLGIDVVALLNRFGLDSSFRPDRITWTGCILFQAKATPSRRGA